jgi:hypothetical protein
LDDYSVGVVVRPESITIVKLGTSTGPTEIMQTRTCLGDKIGQRVAFGGQTPSVSRALTRQMSKNFARGTLFPSALPK